MLPSFKFHHIGIAVKSINDTAAIYNEGGYKQSNTIYDPVQNVNICWLTKEDMPMIELLAPIDESSPIVKILEKQGVTPYHACYIVDNLEDAIVSLRKMHYILVNKPAEAVAIQGSRVAFLFHKDIGLIELVESPAIITE